MTNWKTKKLMVSGILVILFLSAVMPQFASAQAAESAIETIESIWGCATQPFSCAAKGVSLLMNGFLALLIALVAGLMRIVLQFNDNVVNMPAVQAGFGVTLAIANLGFVLAIIVIALATILRSQTYGIKQLLWKLVVAAIVVNFSLVIAGAILGFSSSLTRYFVQGAVPFHGSGSWSSAAADYGSFVNNITQAFGPQGTYGPPSLQKIAQECGLEGTWKNYLCTVGTTLGTGLTSAALNQWLPGGFFSQIIASLMSMVFLLMIFFTFLAITVMLLVRFVYIAILLILAPLAWLLWIFPNTKANFSKWWSHFIKWTFFPPIVIFFLYLAILTGSKTNQGYLDQNSLPPAGTSPNDLPESAIMMSLKDAIGFNLIPQIEQGIILIGFALGGLFAANSLSIAGAGVAMGLAKSAGGAVKGYAFKQGKMGARAAYQRVGGAGVKEKLEGAQYGFIPKRLQTLMGRGIGRFERAGGADIVEKEAAWARDQVKDPVAAGRILAGSLPREKQIALLKAMTDTENLEYVKQVNGVDRDKFIDDNEKMLKSWGQSKFYDKDVQLALGNVKAQEAARAAAANPNAQIADTRNVLGRGVGQMVRAVDLLNASMKQFVQKLERSNVSKFDLNHLFKTDTLQNPAALTRMEAFLRKIGSYNHQLVPSMMSQMKGEQQKNFVRIYVKAINDERADLMGQSPATPEETRERDEALARIDIAEESVGRILLNLATFGGGGGGGTPPTPTAATP